LIKRSLELKPFVLKELLVGAVIIDGVENGGLERYNFDAIIP
jgi:hypothetical protein